MPEEKGLGNIYYMLEVCCSYGYIFINKDKTLCKWEQKERFLAP